MDIAYDDMDFSLEDFPNLSDMLPTLTKKTSLDYENIPGAIIKNLSMDLDKININKFKKKITKIADFMGKNDPTLNASRRQAVVKSSNWNREKEAYIFYVKRKILDLMLQTMYMARHKVKPVEQSKYYSNKGASYRIAFLYQRLKLIKYKIMRRYRYAYNSNHKYSLENVISHWRASYYYVSFDNTFRVLCKIHEIHKAKIKDLDKAINKQQ